MEISLRITTDEAYQLSLGQRVTISYPMEHVYVAYLEKQKRVMVDSASIGKENGKRMVFLTVREIPAAPDENNP